VSLNRVGLQRFWRPQVLQHALKQPQELRAAMDALRPDIESPCEKSEFTHLAWFLGLGSTKASPLSSP